MKINQTFSFSHYLDQIDLDTFIQLTGDDHLLHINDQFASKYGYRKRLAHGMLVAAFFSTLIGKYLPKNHYKYLCQSLTFHQPVYPDTQLTIRGKILHSAQIGIISLKTEIIDQQDQLLISGVAKIKVLQPLKL